MSLFDLIVCQGSMMNVAEQRPIQHSHSRIRFVVASFVSSRRLFSTADAMMIGRQPFRVTLDAQPSGRILVWADALGDEDDQSMRLAANSAAVSSSASCSAADVHTHGKLWGADV